MSKLYSTIGEAEDNTNINPSEKQKLKGNYKKGRIKIKGLDITIENPIGSIRSGVDKDGKKWSSKMKYTYGYFNKTVGKDGDHIDVFIGPIVNENFDVFIIDQINEDNRAFNEHKVMFGFKDANSAKSAYLANYNKGWKGFGNITKISLLKFKSWINNKDAIKYPAKKLSMSQKIDFKNVNLDDKSKLIKLEGEVISGETLDDLKKQAGDLNSFSDLILEIASPGGSVSEGLSIMVWLDYLSSMGKKIITVVSANAYSIASLIMLAADYKMISKHGSVMVHNPMVPELKLMNANDLEKYVSELRKLESIMYELYQIFTGLSEDDIKVLMDNETYLSPDESVEKGFADIVIDVEKKPYSMASNIKKEINMSKTINILNRIISVVNKNEFINQVYHDVDSGNDFEIFQNDPSTYSVGDRTSVENGEVKLSDGSKLIIKDYVITSIDKSIEEDAEPAAEFNEGPAPEETISVEEVVEPVVEPTAEIVEDPVIKGKDEMPSAVIETTESVKTTKETVAVAEDPVAEEIVEDPVAEEIVEDPVAEEIVEDPVSEEKKVDMIKMMEELQETISQLSEKVEGISKLQNSQLQNIKSFKEFEQVATEAIDAIASSTSSSFTPASLKTAEAQPTGTIFQTIMKKRGL